MPGMLRGMRLPIRPLLAAVPALLASLPGIALAGGPGPKGPKCAIEEGAGASPSGGAGAVGLLIAAGAIVARRRSR
jgi:hypothetical protein